MSCLSYQVLYFCLRHVFCLIVKLEPPLEIYGVVEDILLMAEDFDVVVFAWISRERNVESDLLAKNALCLYEQEVGEAGLMPPPN